MGPYFQQKFCFSTTRTDRKSNGKEVRHQVDKKETYIQTGRRGGDRQPGQRGLTWLWGGPRLAECGTNRAGSLTTSRPCSPTFVQINERAGLRVTENGAGRAAGSTPQPYILA